MSRAINLAPVPARVFVFAAGAGLMFDVFSSDDEQDIKKEVAINKTVNTKKYLFI
jgi:hypothetical protein